MSDPVNAADVLRDAHEAWAFAHANSQPATRDLELAQRDALLAYGNGDPVVVMPDGTLRRLRGPWNEGHGAVAGMHLADPVVPE